METGNVVSTATSTMTLARIAFEQGNDVTAQSLFEKSQKLFRQAKDKTGQAFLFESVGDFWYTQRDYEQARGYYQEGLEIWQEVGNSPEIAWTSTSLGYIAIHQEQWQEAYMRFAEGLSLHQERGKKGGIITCLVGLAGVSEELGQPEQAAQLLGAAEAFLEVNDIDSEPEVIRRIFKLSSTNKQTTANSHPELAAGRIEYDRFVTAVRNALDQETFTTAWAKGWEMTLEQAISYALENPWRDGGDS